MSVADELAYCRADRPSPARVTRTRGRRAAIAPRVLAELLARVR
jgi:hypothetical protein